MPAPDTPILLSDCVAWVEGILNRTDLTTKLNDSVVNFYKLLCRKVPFDELMVVSPQIPLISGQATYNLDTMVDVDGHVLDPVLKSIYSIKCTFGPNATSTTVGQQSPSVRLRRSATRLYDAIGYTIPGQTSTYSRFGKTIEVNPAPNASNWSLQFRYWCIAPMDETPVNTTLIMDDDWAELIRWELLYRAYYMLGNTQEAMALVQPTQLPSVPGAPRRRLMTEIGIIPRLWNDLCNTLSSRENADEDFSINPVVRNYSVR